MHQRHARAVPDATTTTSRGARIDGHRHRRYPGHGRGAVPIQYPATLSLDDTQRNLFVPRPRLKKM